MLVAHQRKFDRQIKQAQCPTPKLASQTSTCVLALRVPQRFARQTCWPKQLGSAQTAARAAALDGCRKTAFHPVSPIFVWFMGELADLAWPLLRKVAMCLTAAKP